MKFKITINLILVLPVCITINAQTFVDSPDAGVAGDFPSKWELIGGSAQIETLQGNKVILLSNKAIVSPLLGSKNYLAEKFFLQFDAYFDEVKKTINDQYYRIRFWDGSSHTTFVSARGKGFIEPLQIYRHRVLIEGSGGGSDKIQHNVSVNDLEVKNAVWRLITIDYNRGALKILIDQMQILNIPKFYFKPAMISIEAATHEFGYNLIRAIKNVRLDGILSTGFATTNTTNTNDPDDNTHGNVFLGNNAGLKERGSNKLYIENSDADANSALIYGEFDKNILRTNGRFQIGVPGRGGYSFPASDGSEKQILQTDGKGNLRWVNILPGTNNTQQIDTTVNALSTYGELEAIDEGNGIGWRIKGRDTTHYGNIGLGAIDFSGAYSSHGLSGTNYGATGYLSFATGNLIKASGAQSTAMGYATDASGVYSTAMGSWTTATGMSSTATGSKTISSGMYSTAIGNRTLAESYNSVAIGTYNIGGGDPNNWIDGDPLFEIGIGTGIGSIVRKNAVTVLKNGNTGIGIYQPKVKLQIADGNDASLSNGSGYVVMGEEDKINMVIDNNEILVRNNGTSSTLYLQHEGGDVSVGGKVVHTSDMRLKKNIALLSYGLNEILKMNPVIYQWKNNSNKQSKDIGLLAQDIQPLIKEIVHTGDDKEKTLSISYTELIPVLIKAIQEQQSLIDQQNDKLKVEKKNYEELLKRVERLEQLLKEKQ